MANAAPKPAKVENKRSKISQSDFPNISLEQAMRIPRAICDNFAGKGAAPHQIAMALDLSPTSGGWRNLGGASIAYGLTEGGYNAASINLTEIGRRIVAPMSEGDDLAAKREATLRPRILGEFFRKYDRAKLPRDEIAQNVLVEMGLPKDRAQDLLSLIKENGTFVGFIQDTKTGPFVAITGLTSDRRDSDPRHFSLAVDAIRDEEIDKAESEQSYHNRTVASSSNSHNKRVFITHGKNAKIVEQIKKLVSLGGFDPVVSTQRETAAKPVPDKVMDDMRSCGGAVIHVGSEGVLKDENGAEHPQINPNVLIEIGAAMALYKGRFILVVEDGVRLPSNLQGMYESRYRGDSIELDAGMKVLEALQGLKFG